MRVLLAVTLAALCACSPPVPALWSGLTPGRHGVGYRQLGSDGSTIHVWYPTTGSGERVRFADYVGSDRDGLSPAQQPNTPNESVVKRASDYP
jgi:hypothetical protein